MTERFEKSADHQRSKPLVLSELTSEQLNAEIEKGYQDAINGRTIPLDEVFHRLSEKYGIPEEEQL